MRNQLIRERMPNETISSTSMFSTSWRRCVLYHRRCVMTQPSFAARLWMRSARYQRPLKCGLSGRHAPHKRTRSIEQLFERPEFVDFWALQLGDILQNRKERDHDVRGQRACERCTSGCAANCRRASWPTCNVRADGHRIVDQKPAVGFYIVTVGEKERISPKSPIR